MLVGAMMWVVFVLLEADLAFAVFDAEVLDLEILQIAKELVSRW